MSTGATPPSRPSTVLMGCSFAGLEFLYRYARQRRRLEPGEMTVIEPRERHPYIPLAHEAVSGARSALELLFDTNSFCRAIGAERIQGAVASLDPFGRVVRLADGRALPYDRAIVAVGSLPAVPDELAGHPNIVPVKFVYKAVELRQRLRLLRASSSRMLRVVVVGAGITGVEWSAEVAGGRVDGTRVAVTLVGADPRILPSFHAAVAKHAAHVLSRLGVEMLLGHRVASVGEEYVVLDDGVAVPFDVIVWTGGMRPNPVLREFGLPLNETGHLIVTPRLAVPGHEGVYGMGDAVRIVERGVEWPTMQRAIEAIWQGAYLARRLVADLPPDAGPEHRLRRDFPYGLSLGPRHSAVVYKGWYADRKLFVRFRRWLQWAYYARLEALGRICSRERVGVAGE